MSNSDQIQISHVSTNDVAAIKQLYQHVAAVPDGIARRPGEISTEYVSQFVANSLDRGLGLVAKLRGQVVGEIHAYCPEPSCFAHMFSDLTVAVDPANQGMGVGRLLFQHWLQEVINHHPDIIRVELITRASNAKALKFYESLGFAVEGCMQSRIRNADGSLVDDIPMAWCRDQA